MLKTSQLRNHRKEQECKYRMMTLKQKIIRRRKIADRGKTGCSIAKDYLRHDHLIKRKVSAYGKS